MSEEQNLLQQSEPDPNEKELRALWREVGKDMVKGSVKTLDEVGKQLIAVDGVLVGLYFNAIAFSDLHAAALQGGQVWVYMLPVVFLLLSLFAALMLFYPDRYSVDVRSISAIKLVHGRAAAGKLLLVRLSAWMLLLGILFIGLALYIYLRS